MEYGRECWGSPYLSSLSNPLSDSKCNIACEGNSSELCGGSLTITLYNLTDKSATHHSMASRELGVGAGGMMGFCIASAMVAVVGFGAFVGL